VFSADMESPFHLQSLPRMTTRRSGISTTHSTQAGLNAKVGAELKLGRVSFGLSYIMGLTLNSGIGVQSGTGLLGANATFWFE